MAWYGFSSVLSRSTASPALRGRSTWSTLASANSPRSRAPRPGSSRAPPAAPARTARPWAGRPRPSGRRSTGPGRRAAPAPPGAPAPSPGRRPHRRLQRRRRELVRSSPARSRSRPRRGRRRARAAADPAGPDLVGAHPTPRREHLEPVDLAGPPARQVEPLAGPHRAAEHPDVGDLLPGRPALDLEHPPGRLGRAGAPARRGGGSGCPSSARVRRRRSRPTRRTRGAARRRGSGRPRRRAAGPAYARAPRRTP